MGLALAGGCNQIYELQPTVRTDAQVFDAPADAPFQCPPPGTAPTFAPGLHQSVIQPCVQYSVIRTGQAVATCLDPDRYQILEGRVDEPLVRAAGLDAPGASEFDDSPVLSQDGTHLLVRRFDVDLNIATMLHYTRSSDGAWRRLADPPFGPDQDSIGPMAAVETGSVVVVRTTDSVLHEWIDEAGTWRELRALTPVELGLDPIYRMALTGDGLRALVFGGLPVGVWYTDRSSTAQPFRPVTPLPGAPPNGFDGFMTEDCARYYVAGLGSVFYAQQR